jgi:methionyl-tRNA formyltransferase
MDGGPILTSRWTSIKPEETAGELHDRLAGVGVDAVDAALQLYQDGALPQGEPQDDSQATRAPKLKKTDGYIDFNQPAKSVASFICGMTPWPGAVARFEAMDGRWEQVQLLRARPAPVPGTTEPGKTDPDLPDDEPGVIDSRCYIGAADGYVELLEIKPSSGRIMSWKDYVNGRHVEAGDMFTTPSVPRPS